MTTLLGRLFRLRPGEAGLVTVMGLLLLSNSLALEISGVVSVSGFLSEVEAPNILIVWLVDMVLIIAMAGLQSLIVDRFERIKLIRWMSFALALIYVFLRLMFTLQAPSWLNYSLLYLLAEQQWLFFPLVFWILANDIFDVTQTKRLFPLIASWGFVGQILGFIIAAASPSLLRRLNVSSAEVLSLNVVIYLLVYFLVTEGLGKIKVRHTIHQRESVAETLTEGWGFVREVPAFRFLMLAILALSVALTMIEYRFLVVADATFTEPGEFQTFYSLYNLLLTVIAIAIQSFVTSRLIERVALKNAFFVLPMVIFSCASWMLALPNLLSTTAAALVSRITKSTVDESTQKAFQALVPEERRGRVSMFMDSYLFAFGTILGCLITGAIVVAGREWTNASAYQNYLPVAVLMGVFAILAIVKMRRVYDTSLFNWRLKRRQRASSLLDKLEL